MAGAAGSLKISIYGLSTEGYNVAMRLGRLGYNVTVVDEVMQQAIPLDQSLLEAKPNVSTLIHGERLVSFKPSKMALAESDILLVAPRLKRESDEARSEMRDHLKEIAKHIKEGCHIISLAPEGLGDGKFYLQIISTASGLSQTDKFAFLYSPKNNIIGSNRQVVEKRVLSVLRAAGFTSSITPLEVAEAAYTHLIIRTVSEAAIALEMGRRNFIVESKTRYIDDVAPQIYDAKLVSASLEDGDPLQQLAFYLIRILSSYPRYLAEKLKLEAKKTAIRLSHTTAYILWSHDQNEMRPVRRIILSLFEAKLREMVEEVRIHRGREYPISEGPQPILIPCSRRDHEWTETLSNEFPVLVANMNLNWFPSKKE